MGYSSHIVNLILLKRGLPSYEGAASANYLLAANWDED